MNRLFLLLSLALALALASGTGCSPESLTVEDGELSFSSDTVFFDSLFTGFDSPSERLIVRNYTDHNIRITRIYLEKGSQSDFSLIVDGLAQDSIEGYVLDSGDSAVVFISYTSTLRDDFAKDRIIFQVGDETRHVNLEAFVMDAVFWQDTVLYGVQTLDPSKRHVVDGYLLVAPDAQLTIPAGTRMYFTPRKDEDFNFISRLEVWGTLIANGQINNEVVFQQTRGGEDYNETPGQWRGLRFYSTAERCELRHSLVKNAVIGIEVDSITHASAAAPKVILDRCEIRNMAGYGILGLGFSGNLGNRSMLRAQSTLVHNCKEGTVFLFGGGNYQFYNCTFANYTVDFIRNSPQLGISNYYEFYDYSYLVKADFVNCIIWGSEEEEVVFDSSDVDGLWDVSFDHCMIRTTESIPGSGNLISQSQDYPRFWDPTRYDPASRDYHFRSGSPALDAGVDVAVLQDLDSDFWTSPYDLGAYQYP